MMGVAYAEDDVDMQMIPGGTFVMGSPADEPERSNDEVQHTVAVSDFYLSSTEISQADYISVMGINPSEEQGDELPVTNVSWYEAIQFCNALSLREGLVPCYEISDTTVTGNRSANGYRLPTEAEWEYAARAGTETPFWFGDYVHDEDANCYNAYGYNNDASGHWVNGYPGYTFAVDSHATNAYGLYNVHGNAGEWVWDWYGAYTDEAADPTGPVSGDYKVVRGGGWNDMPKHIRSAYRSVFPADGSLYSIGFRIARSAAAIDDCVTSQYDDAAVSAGGKVLIAYFSQTGNTEGLAEIIAQKTGADVFRIERAVPYSADYNSTKLYGEALTELRESAVPDLARYMEDEGLSIDDYDTILLGYCNWWASIPAPVVSFLSHYNLTGKTIIPFCSMGGGRFGQTISAICKLTPGSAIQNGLDITYSNYDNARIDAWLERNHLR